MLELKDYCEDISAEFACQWDMFCLTCWCNCQFSDLEDFDVEAAIKKKQQTQKKVSQARLENRYPKRNIKTTNYADLEIPDDDHFLCKQFDIENSLCTNVN